MKKSVRQLCCVCSGNGEHDLHGRIPVTIHANPNEFRFWRQTIAEMIADISGIYVSTNTDVSILQIKLMETINICSFRLPHKDNQR